MTWPNNIQSNTPPPYRFKLVNPDGNHSLILKTYPLGWQSGMLEFSRRIEVGGVFANFATDSLTFFKEGADFLRGIWEEKEFNGKCDLHVYYWKFTTQAYVEFPNSFALYFPDCEPRVKFGRNTIGFRIKTQNNNTLMLLDNRKKTNVDLTKLTSLGGYPIVDYGSLVGVTLPFLRKNINIGAIDISNSADLRNSGFDNDLYRVEGFTSYTTLKLDMNYSDFAEVQSTPYVKQKVNFTQLTPVFSNALYSYTMDVYWSFYVEVTDKHSSDCYTLKLIETNSSFIIQNEYSLQAFGEEKWTHNFNGTLTITLSPGNNLYLVVEVQDVEDIAAYVYLPAITFQQRVAHTAALTVEGYPLYLAFERVLQHCLDYQFPFYSDYLATLDVVYDADGSTYASENQLNLFSVITGLGFRGAKLADINNPFPLSFDTLYNSCSAMLNLGYTLQQIGNYMRVRVEEYSWFFDSTVVLDLSSRISIYDIETEAMPELAYQKILVGYKDFKYEAQNGRGEYNTQHERTTILNTNTELNLVSELRGDSMEMITRINDPIDVNGTTDAESDNSMFILKTQHDEVVWPYGWKPEKEENITIEEGSSILGDSSMNLYPTPYRMLKRNGNRIKAGLTKFPESYVKYQHSQKLQTLKTTGEGYTAVENEDILVNDLADPIFKAIKHTVECRFTFADLEILQALISGTDKPGYMGVIKFSETISGYLLNLKKKNKEDKAVITIIEKYN